MLASARRALGLLAATTAVLAQAEPAPRPAPQPPAPRLGVRLLSTRVLGQLHVAVGEASGMAGARGDRAVDHLLAVLPRVLDGRPGAVRAQLVRTNEYLLVRGEPRCLEAIDAMFVELAQPAPRRAQLEVAWLDAPAELVRDCGHPFGQPVRIDDTQWNLLSRAAQKENGSLRNVPAIVALPLRPFALEPAVRPSAPGGLPSTLHATLVPLAADEFALALHAGSKPATAVRAPAPPAAAPPAAVPAAQPGAAVPVPPTGATGFAAVPPLRIVVASRWLVAIAEGDRARVLTIACSAFDPPR
jgi:hypothetical protein